MKTSPSKKTPEKTAISDQEVLQHIGKIDKKLKSKNTLLILFSVILILSIGANVAQFLHLI